MASRVPFVQQLEAADCGAACLAMVLGYWGHDIGLAPVREALAVSGHGLSAKSIIDGAVQFGLRGRGVKIEVEKLRHLPAGAILHWSFGHWIVFERLERDGVRVVDPAFGRRLIPLDRFRKKFTGVALVLAPTEGFTRRREKRPSAWPYVRRLFADRGFLLRILAITGLIQLLGLVVPATIGLVIDRVVPTGDRSLLWIVVGGGGAIVGFGLMAWLIRGYLLVELRTRLDFDLATRFMGHLISLPYAFFQRHQSGDLMMRVISNSRIRDFLASTVVSALLDGVLTVSYLIVITVMCPWMTLVVLGLGAARVAVLLIVRRKIADAMAAQLDASSRAQGFLAEMIAGIQTLKAAGRERAAIDRWTNLYSEDLEEASRGGRLEGAATAGLEALEIAAPLAVLGVGATMVLRGSLSLGAMLALVALASAFLLPLRKLVDAGIQLSLLRSYLERVEDVLATEPEQAGPRMPAPRLKGHIMLDRVSFRYGRDQPLAIDNVSLEILPGQTVAIVGMSGSGKSTLANLLLGLYQPTEGDLRFDGVSIRDLDLVTLRHQVGVVSQHPYLFAGTIRENLTMNDATVPLSRCIEAARRARLHDDIMRLPMRYHSLLPDRGESLSGGQRQRLALARSLLRKPAILLLDEATSALDSKIEQEITSSIERLRCTRIVIAHRLSTIIRADKIILLDHGRVAEVGRHDELLARGELYRELVVAQLAMASQGAA